MNSDGKKVRYKMNCYILNTFILVTTLLFIIVYDFNHYLHKVKVKTKRYWHTNNIKIENNELKKICIKDCTCYYFRDN